MTFRSYKELKILFVVGSINISSQRDEDLPDQNSTLYFGTESAQREQISTSMLWSNSSTVSED